MISLTAEANKNFFDLLLIKYPHLNVFKLKNNVLEFYDYKINLGEFKLINLNQISYIFSFKPFEIFQIIKIHSDIEEEKNYINKNEYNPNTLYLEIRAILVKDIIDGAETKKINDFAAIYKVLWQYQDFLLDDAKNKLNNMNNVIIENLYSELLKITPGISALIKALNLENYNFENNNSKSQSLVLTNTKYPSTISDTNNYLTKSGNGFANGFLLIYIILNIGFILAILIIK